MKENLFDDFIKSKRVKLKFLLQCESSNKTLI